MRHRSPVQVLLAFAVLGLCGCPNKDHAPTTGTRTVIGPRLELAERKFDVGEVDYGQEYTHTFKLANKGDQPLQLRVVRMSCACGDIKVPTEPIAPGAEASVTFTWRPIPGKVGRDTLAVDLETNDASEKDRAVRLEMTGQINPAVRFSPAKASYLDFDRIGPEGGRSLEVQVFSTRLPGFGLEVSTPEKGLKIDKTPLAPGDRVEDETPTYGYRVVVKTTDQLPPGYLRTDLTFRITAGAQTRTVRLPVYGQVDNGDFSVSPAEARLQTPKIAQGDSTLLSVRFFVPKPGDHLEVVCVEPPFVEVSKPEDRGQGLWQFRVTVPKDNPAALKFQPVGSFEGRVVLKSSRSNQQVPLRVIWRPR